MTLQQLANVFNLAGIGIVLLISLHVMRSHRRPFFGQWVRAYACTFTIVAMELLASLIDRPVWLSLLEVAVCATGAWYFWSTGRNLQGRAPSRRWFPVLLAVSLAVSAAMFAIGFDFKAATGAIVVLNSLASVYLGWTLVGMARHSAAPVPSIRWLGGPQIAMGLWVFTFPLFEKTPLFALGFVVSGILDILVGVGMVVYLLEEASVLLEGQNARLEEATVRLEAQNAQLVQAARLKQTFLSIVSHELRTPLAAIMGFHELLEDQVAGPLNAEQQEFLGQIQSGALQLSTLIDSMLDGFQLESGTLRIHKERVDLRRVIDEAVAPLASAMAAKPIGFEVLLPQDLPAVIGDHPRVVQVVGNLLSNAVKFTEAGGSIQVAARREGPNVRVEIADTGIGIQPEHLSQVFESFFQADVSLTRRYGGSGLGLMIVRNLVTRMGGEVGVTSDPGRGSCFSFTLSAAGDEPGATARLVAPETVTSP